jgi:hypothetical protein
MTYSGSLRAWLLRLEVRPVQKRAVVDIHNCCVPVTAKLGSGEWRGSGQTFLGAWVNLVHLLLCYNSKYVRAAPGLDLGIGMAASVGSLARGCFARYSAFRNG